jgi:hypothetical protein
MWPLNSFPQTFSNPNAYMAPRPNANFTHSFGNAFPNPGMNQPWGAKMGAPWAANMGFNPGPNLFRPNLPFYPMNMNWQPQPQPEPDFYGQFFKGLSKTPELEGKHGMGGLSGRASISGGTFKSLDGESWEPNVQSGKSYNLLSTECLQVNGAFSSCGGEMIMSQLGVLYNGSQLTLAADGTILIDGEEFKKNKNDMGGALKRSSNGSSYTLTTQEGYVFTLRPSSSNGVRMTVAANNVAPGAGGLLGSANDGDVETPGKLRSRLPAKDFVVEDILTFDAVKSAPNNDFERGALLWASRNPKFDKVELKIDQSFSYSADGKPAADWKMNALKPNSSYLLFSEVDLSVSGTFGTSVAGGNQPLTSVSVVIDGMARTVRRNAATGQLELFDKNGNSVKAAGFIGNSITFPAKNADGESYDIRIDKGQTAGSLALTIVGQNVGANDTRSGGLLGDAVGAQCTTGNTDNGAGILRDEDGGVSKPGSSMKFALPEFLLDSPFDTESDRGATEVTEAVADSNMPSHRTFSNILGSTWGDPHFNGADGELYDIQGKAGTIYNIVSDQGLQVNSLFGAWGAGDGTTVMKKLGFSINGQQLEVGVDEAKRVMTYKLNGQELDPANLPSWITMANDQITITSDFQGEKWKFVVDLAKHGYGDHLNLTSKAITIDNFVETAGIWGHSVGDNDLYKLTAGVYQKGGGGILRNADGTTLAFDKKEGSAEHTAALSNYVETGLFSTTSHWSQFNK